MKEQAHFDWRTVMTASPDMPAKSIVALDNYFKQFVALTIKPGTDDAKPEIEPQRCVQCDEPLTGFQALILGRGGFEWGLAHGHGHCRACKWPCVAHHFIKDEDGEHVCTLHNVILQIHPDLVESKATP